MVFEAFKIQIILGLIVILLLDHAMTALAPCKVSDCHVIVHIIPFPNRKCSFALGSGLPSL